MADFKTAIDWLLRGWKIKRENWSNNYIHMSESLHLKDKNNVSFILSKDDLETDDWDLYKDKMDLEEAKKRVKKAESAEEFFQVFVDFAKSIDLDLSDYVKKLSKHFKE